MQRTRRKFLLYSALAPLLSALEALAEPPGAGGVTKLIRLNLPGPGSLPFLPLELIPALGFDREMGAHLLLRYHPSGIRALEDTLLGNADFAALGFPTLPVMHASGKDAVAIAPLAGISHSFQLMVRKDLVKQIRRIGDLKGRTIAISTGSPSSKTYMQMLCEIILGTHGVGGHQVRWLPAGQNWESISGAFISQAADAVLCEQPFPLKLMRAGLGISLADLNDPKIQAQVPGISALRSAVITPRNTLDLPETQEKAELMVRMLRRTLVWLQATSPETVARQAKVRSEMEREDIAMLLKTIPGIYSTDARFVRRQIEETDRFLQAAHPGQQFASAMGMVSMRWAGEKS
jgi:NitT/TauT family transport system substrate-binding protein